MTLTQHLILESMISSIRRVLLDSPAIIAFGWGILQMKLHKSKLRKATGIFVILVSALLEGYWNSLGSIRLHMLFIDYGLKWPNKYLNFGIVLIIQLIFYIGIVLLFDEKIIKGILKVYFLILSDGIIIEVATFVVGGIKEFFNLQYTDNVNAVICVIAEVLIICCIACFIKRKETLVLCIRNIPVLYFIICLVIYDCYMLIPRYISNHYSNLDYSIRGELLFLGHDLAKVLYALSITLIFICLWLRQYKRENYLKNQYLQMLGDYYSGVANHINEVRSIKHDMKAHMNVLKGYLNAEDLNQARDYLSEIIEHQSYNNSKVINVGHEFVSAVLTEAMQRDENKGIILDCEGVLPKELPIADFDLCTIFSNIIVNSTEACNLLKEKEKRIILRIKILQRNVVITCENPIEWEIDISKLKGHTSKRNKEIHGYGLRNIEKTIAKYGGEMKLSAEEGKFQIGILLYQIIEHE